LTGGLCYASGIVYLTFPETMFGRKKKSVKTLKVGLLHGDKPLVEQSIKFKGKVTIGTQDNNTFTLHWKKLPKKFVIFKPQGKRYILNFLPGMDGKIAVKETALPFATLKKRGVVESKKGVHSISISDNTRGKITFDNYRILFRFEEA
jgi:hypothetical protein